MFQQERNLVRSDTMNWKDILKAKEKMHCGSEKADDEKEEFEKKLIGNQKRIDANKDGKITGEDFKLLNKRELKEGDTVVSHDECKDMEKKILAEVKKEGGALGMKNLKGMGSPKKIKMVLKDMMERGTIKQHKHGDFYTDNPSRGRGFTA